MTSLRSDFLNFARERRLLFAILLCFIYGYLGYFLARSEFYLFFSLVTIAFIISYLLIEKCNLNFAQLLCLSVVYKLILIASVPQLSQDFFRFFWDGQLILNGVNPYLNNVDSYFVQNAEFNVHQAEVLRQGMGSLNSSNYSNYPPFSQLLYLLSAWFAKASIPLFIGSLRFMLIGFDLVFIFFGRKILIYLNKDPEVLFWYVLSPLCILEVSGNLHLEGVMIALFAASAYALIKKNYLLCGVFLSLSVGTKLLSVIALPLIVIFLWRKTNALCRYKNIGIFLFAFLAVLALQFLPFLDSAFFNNYTQTIGLWFGKFEFNASIYYLIRWLGFQVYGFNIIQTYGAIMPLATILIFSLFIYRTKAKIKAVIVNFMWMLTIYFLLSTTVHPWYILFPLALSIFTKLKFMRLWSFLILLSYYSYRDFGSEGVHYLIALEYILVLTYMIYELKSKKFTLKFSS